MSADSSNRRWWHVALGLLGAVAIALGSCGAVTGLTGQVDQAQMATGVLGGAVGTGVIWLAGEARDAAIQARWILLVSAAVGAAVGPSLLEGVTTYSTAAAVARGGGHALFYGFFCAIAVWGYRGGGPSHDSD